MAFARRARNFRQLLPRVEPTKLECTCFTGLLSPKDSSCFLLLVSFSHLYSVESVSYCPHLTPREPSWRLSLLRRLEYDFRKEHVAATMHPQGHTIGREPQHQRLGHDMGVVGHSHHGCSGRECEPAFRTENALRFAAREGNFISCLKSSWLFSSALSY